MAKSDVDTGLHLLTDLDEVIHAPARLMILTHLYVVESVEYVFLNRLPGLTWGNLAAHLPILEEADYVEINGDFRGKKPHITFRLTEQGRDSFREYKNGMQ